ncbi:hypothetical protein FQR65_LT19415 [Abscondita terminalis]|nr:hypothetical protein FQR65_LT19415 [Abscondita terminalis]
MDACELMNEVNFDIIRLAEMMNSTEPIEPYFRKADLVTISCNAVESISEPFSAQPQVSSIIRHLLKLSEPTTMGSNEYGTFWRESYSEKHPRKKNETFLGDDRVSMKTTAINVMEKLKSKIDMTKLPKHVAIIMDGNGRWAKSRGEERTYGHRSAIQSVRTLLMPDEIIHAVKSIAKDTKDGKLNPEDINNQLFESRLYTKEMPPVDLMIRTSGEIRISNFLLWQIAYAELQFLDIFWPDFTKDDFFNCILNYQDKERRYGKTSEQIEADKA